MHMTVYMAIFKERKNMFKMNKDVGMLLQKKANTSGVYRDKNYEEIYIPPYNNTY